MFNTLKAVKHYTRFPYNLHLLFLHLIMYFTLVIMTSDGHAKFFFAVEL